jgi:choline dehydrogenase-like flavoprotein
VILTAGAIGPPHILQLSGVGDPEHLGRIGVPVVHELRGVGKNMQDHYVARVSYPVVGAQTAHERWRGLPLAGEIMRWLFTGKGMLTYSPSIVAASVNVLEDRRPPTCRSPSRQAAPERPDRRARGDPRPQRRRLAAAIVATGGVGPVQRSGTRRKGRGEAAGFIRPTLASVSRVIERCPAAEAID